VDQGEHFFDAFLDLYGWLLGDLEPKPDVVSYCHIGEQGVGLENHAHIPLVGWLVGNICPVNFDHPGGWDFKASHHA